MTGPADLDAYLRSLRPIAGVLDLETPDRGLVDRVIGALVEAEAVNEEAVSRLIAGESGAILVVAVAAGMAQEQLLNQLRYRFGTSSFARLSREKPDGVAAMFAEMGALERVAAGRERAWTYADVVHDRLVSRSRAGRAIARGRALEEVVRAQGFRYAMRTRFIGRGRADAPCDLAVPGAGADARIVVAIKGFDSTGSKLSDAVREIEQMAEIRRPDQYVYAVVDGIGWLRRRRDLERAHQLWVDRRIDGMYRQDTLGEMAASLGDAAARLRLT